MGIFPDVVAWEKISGSITVAGVPASGSTDTTIDIGDRYLLFGVPEVSTTTANASVIVINGGDHSFTIRVSNADTVAQDVAVDYKVNALKSM